MANVNSTLTMTRGALLLREDGTTLLRVPVHNATGTLLEMKEILIPIAGPIVDEQGNVVNATVPAAYTTAKTAFLAQCDSLFDGAVTASKIIL